MPKSYKKKTWPVFFICFNLFVETKSKSIIGGKWNHNELWLQGFDLSHHRDEELHPIVFFLHNLLQEHQLAFSHLGVHFLENSIHFSRRGTLTFEYIKGMITFARSAGSLIFPTVRRVRAPYYKFLVLFKYGRKHTGGRAWKPPAWVQVRQRLLILFNAKSDNSWEIIPPKS